MTIIYGHQSFQSHVLALLLDVRELGLSYFLLHRKKSRCCLDHDILQSACILQNLEASLRFKDNQAIAQSRLKLCVIPVPIQTETEYLVLLWEQNFFVVKSIHFCTKAMLENKFIALVNDLEIRQSGKDIGL